MIKITSAKEKLKPIRSAIKVYAVETLLFEQRAALFCLIRNDCWDDFTKAIKRLSGELSTKISYCGADDIYP